MAAAKVELKSSFVRTAEASSTELASAESEPWARDRASCGTVLPLGYARVEFHNHAV
jgi:hypothetical protein